MMLSGSSIILIFLVVVMESVPLINEMAKSDNGEFGDHFEGDMVLEPNQWRNGVPAILLRWPYGTVFYEFADHFNDEHKRYIRDIFNHLESKTCLKFKPRTNEKGYIHVKVSVTIIQSNVLLITPFRTGQGQGLFLRGGLSWQASGPELTTQ